YGDQHPIRSVVQLVVQFIDGLFQYISLQQDPEVAWVFGHEAGSFDLFKISLKIEAADVVVPQICPFQQVIFLPLVVELVLHNRTVHRIMEGTDHSGHIPQRRAFQAALTISFSGLPFKVNDDKVSTCPQHLPQVEIPVVSDLHGINFMGENPLENRSEEHTSELQSRENLVCRLLLEKKN